jgi:hypothetical protein
LRGSSMVSLALPERSPGTAMSMRDRPARSATCVSGLCGALWGSGRPAAWRPTSIVC